MRHSTPLAVLVVVALACRTATAPVAAPTVRASVARAEVPAGQKVWVDVTVTNETRRPIQIPGSLDIALLEVRDAAGRVVAFGRYEPVLMMLYPPRWLAPGATVTDRVPWSGEVEGDQLGSGSAAPGRYEVRAAVPLRSRNTVIYSAPVTVLLTPP